MPFVGGDPSARKRRREPDGGVRDVQSLKAVPASKRKKDDDGTSVGSSIVEAPKHKGGATQLTQLTLTPCRICHRRPTKKSDLDSFAGCQGCGERTCYVCMRECPGWKEGDEDEERRQDGGEVRRGEASQGGLDWPMSGHRGLVCSRCCVERGAEGHVVCLGCLASIGGRESEGRE